MAARNPDRRLIDLNASRAARREQARKKPLAVKLGTKTYELPGSLPMSAMIAFVELQAGEVSAFRTLLECFFDDKVDEVLKAGLELDDLYEIMAWYTEDEGVGGSSGSAKSSSSTGTPSKRTSAASTA